jgi:hypothetical protein
MHVKAASRVGAQATDGPAWPSRRAWLRSAGRGSAVVAAAAGVCATRALRAEPVADPRPARVWPVSVGDSLAEALRAAADGDVVELAAGHHHGQVGVVLQRRLTLRGAGPPGATVLHADGRHAEGKAILVLRHGDILVQDLEFRGTRVPSANGAGIRFERGRLRVERCGFFDNQMGLLSGNTADAEIEVLDSRFGAAPVNEQARPHLLYVGAMGRLLLAGCDFSGGRRAHLVKSRARLNHVLANRLVDGPGGEAAYELEFPDGGVAVVVGNCIGQAAATSNLAMLSFAAELRADDPDTAQPAPREHALFVAHNSFVNDADRPARFLHVWAERAGSGLRRHVVNNLFVGRGVADERWHVPEDGNHALPHAALADAAALDWALTPGSPLRGQAVAQPVVWPGLDGQPQGPAPLRPAWQFEAPAGRAPLAKPARWSPGAIQR